MDGIPPGWAPRPTTVFDTLVGPFHYTEEAGAAACGFLADERHGNRRGVVHGGMLTTAFDVALGNACYAAGGGRFCATIQLNVHFVGAMNTGEFAVTRPEIVRVTRSLIFARGVMAVGDRLVASGDGIWKLLEPRPAP